MLELMISPHKCFQDFHDFRCKKCKPLYEMLEKEPVQVNENNELAIASAQEYITNCDNGAVKFVRVVQDLNTDKSNEK